MSEWVPIALSHPNASSNSSVPSAPLTVPCISAARTVLFPGMRCGIVLASEAAECAASVAFQGGEEKNDGLVGVFSSHRPSVAERRLGIIGINPVGTLARIVGRVHVGSEFTAIQVQGCERVRVESTWHTDPFWLAGVQVMQDKPELPEIVEVLVDEIIDAAAEMTKHDTLFDLGRHLLSRIRQDASPSTVPGVMGNMLAELPIERQRELLCLPKLSQRLDGVLAEMQRRISYFNAGAASH